MTTTSNREREAIKTAMDAFFTSLAESYPEIKSGDFPPDALNEFDYAASDAVAAWLQFNRHSATRKMTVVLEVPADQSPTDVDEAIQGRMRGYVKGIPFVGPEDLVSPELEQAVDWTERP